MNIEGRPVTATVSGLGDPLLPGARGQGAYRAYAKRVFDIFLVLAVAPIALPLVVFLAGLVALSGGQPFYTQTRLGFGGRAFNMWKLRTMVPDAEACLAAYLETDPMAKAEWARHQKLRHDPRITRLGAILRATSLDELPQLWNVFLGHMSLVGPRPMMTGQRALYPGHAYYRMRPGITGTWQVSDRHETSFAARAEFDRAYDASLSWMQDLRILCATIGVVFRATGR